MLNLAKLKIGNRIYNKHAAVRERGVVQSITPTGKVRVKYENGKTRLHAAAQLTRMPPGAIRRSKKAVRKEDSFALYILENLPEKIRDDVWKSVTSTNLTVREVLEVKELLPKEK